MMFILKNIGILYGLLSVCQSFEFLNLFNTPSKANVKDMEFDDELTSLCVNNSSDCDKFVANKSNTLDTLLASPKEALMTTVAKTASLTAESLPMPTESSIISNELPLIMKTHTIGTEMNEYELRNDESTHLTQATHLQAPKISTLMMPASKESRYALKNGENEDLERVLPMPSESTLLSTDLPVMYDMI